MAKTKYDTNVKPKLFLIEAWARDGLTDEQISKNLGIAYSTFRRYKDDNEALSAALKKGKEVIDYEVENALIKRALGYDYEEVQTIIEDDGGKTKKRVSKTKKHIPPDTTAIAIWLNNRRPDRWRRNYNKERLDEDKHEHEKDIDSKRYF